MTMLAFVLDLSSSWVLLPLLAPLFSSPIDLPSSLPSVSAGPISTPPRLLTLVLFPDQRTQPPSRLECTAHPTIAGACNECSFYAIDSFKSRSISILALSRLTLSSWYSTIHRLREKFLSRSIEQNFLAEHGEPPHNCSHRAKEQIPSYVCVLMQEACTVRVRCNWGAGMRR
ncbi:hypothetical protein EV421DRAFT_1440163 [Armillaria borealis]|uniref:Secreted protein n=1 Tax=Armillaria borealis TaxID=47425 RepID=A0AA39J0R2_9AGAR|nr:hypothetical protein EV421DRAFT_1440163 [Armillaria borealis]